MNYPEVNLNAEKTADAIIRNIGSLKPSIPDLKWWTEKNFGIPIKILPSFGEHFAKYSGLTYFDPGAKQHVIYFKAADYYLRQNFTICHELGHIILNSGVAYGLSDGELYAEDEEERYCDRFAAAFLMPKDIFRQKWEAFRSYSIIQRKVLMTRTFGASGEAVLYRLKELEMNTDLTGDAK